MTASECDEILRMLADQRRALLITMRGIDDSQARERTTVSELSLGGVIKHVALVERNWLRIFAERQASPDLSSQDSAAWLRMAEDETLIGLIDDYAAVGRETEDTVRALPDLDHAVPLPTTPWRPESVEWPRRRILLHVLRETAQHCGHADIIREALDGANTTQQLLADLGFAD